MELELVMDEPLLLLRLIWLAFFLLPIGVGYLAWLWSSLVAGKLRKSQSSLSRFVLNDALVGKACDTVVGQVDDEAELEEDALEIEEAVDKNDDALSDGSKL